ncbi:MAG: zinc ribbon domain-containing protein [Planctomycetes bacterium]|nr:zinc ribbon domain-containing protein [Planctomycetota bacterium]
MSACAKCGFDNPPGGRFCSECGGPLAAACGACNSTASPPGSKFCVECGAPLGGAPAAAPAGAANRAAARRPGS